MFTISRTDWGHPDRLVPLVFVITQRLVHYPYIYWRFHCIQLTFACFVWVAYCHACKLSRISYLSDFFTCSTCYLNFDCSGTLSPWVSIYAIIITCAKFFCHWPPSPPIRSMRNSPCASFIFAGRCFRILPNTFSSQSSSDPLPKHVSFSADSCFPPLTFSWFFADDSCWWN